MDTSNLSEHDKKMLAVAEGGDPNDPAENKDEVVKLPSEELKESEQSQEETADQDKEEASEGEQDESKKDDVKDDTKDDEDDAKEGDTEELTEEQKELAQLRQEKRDNAILDAVGGEKAYKELAAWARNELSEGQAEVYNSAINNGSPEQAAFAAKALNSMRELEQIKKYGYQGEVTNPGGKGSSAYETQGYESSAQMQADMSDKRYRTDPAFRAKVEQKVAQTAAGIL